MPIVLRHNAPAYDLLAGGSAKVAPAEAHADPEPDPEVLEAKAEKVSQRVIDKVLPRIK